MKPVGYSRGVVSLLLALNFVCASACGVTEAADTEGSAESGGQNDCISEFTNTDRLVRLKTGNGRESAIYRDQSGRVELITVNGESFQPIYAPDLPDKMIGVRSVADGKEQFIRDLQSLDVRPKVANALDQPMNKVALGKCGQGSRTEASDAPASSVTAMDLGSEFETEWSEYGFEEYYMEDWYWEAEHEPYFLAAYDGWAANAATRQCLDRVSSCNDTCDYAADMRSYSCMVMGLVYIEIPVASAILVGVCTYASNQDKYRCKNWCPSTSSCF